MRRADTGLGGTTSLDPANGLVQRYTSGMTLANYKVVVYRQLDGTWVAEVPAIGGCYALMDTREAALEELGRVFRLIAEEHAERGQALPTDTTQIVHA